MDTNTILWIIAALLASLIAVCGVLAVVLNHHLGNVATNLRRIEYELDCGVQIVKGKHAIISRLNEYFDKHHYSEFERNEILDYISKGG